MFSGIYMNREMIHLFNSMNIYPGIPIPDIPAENSSPEPDAVAAVLDSRHNYERILCHGPLSGVKSIEAGGNTTLLKFIERLMQERQFIDTLNEKIINHIIACMRWSRLSVR